MGESILTYPSDRTLYAMGYTPRHAEGGHPGRGIRFRPALELGSFPLDIFDPRFGYSRPLRPVSLSRILLGRLLLPDLSWNGRRPDLPAAEFRSGLLQAAVPGTLLSAAAYAGSRRSDTGARPESGSSPGHGRPSRRARLPPLWTKGRVPGRPRLSGPGMCTRVGSLGELRPGPFRDGTRSRGIGSPSRWQGRARPSLC